MLYLLSLFLSPKYIRPFPVVVFVEVLCIFHIRSFILVEKAIVAHAKIRVTYVILVIFVDLSTQLKYIQQKCTRKKKLFPFLVISSESFRFFFCTSHQTMTQFAYVLRYFNVQTFSTNDLFFLSYLLIMLLFFIILAHRAILWQVSLIFNQSTVKNKTFQTIN